MADRRNSTGSRPSSSAFGGLGDEDSIFNTRQLETFGRKVTATASHLLGDASNASTHYHSALGEIHRELRHPLLQRNIFQLAHAAPRELLRSKLSTNEIQHRALTYLPDELLKDIPENSNAFSLFQGFEATLPEVEKGGKANRRGRYGGRGRKLLENDVKGPPGLDNLRNEKDGLDHRLEMMVVRKNMCSTEIREIDARIANLNSQRKIVLDRLADLEQEEQDLEQEIYDVDSRLDDLEEELEDQAALDAQRQKTPTKSSDAGGEGSQLRDSPGMEASFMSESIYEKLPSPKSKRPKPGRRRHTNFILHEHLQSGSKIRELQAHNDVITSIDFDVPFGTMVSASLDDTVRVFDLNTGRCIGLLDGHLSSVRCLQVEDNLVATGSLDATVRLWDLSQADYTPKHDSKIIKQKYHADAPEEDEDIDFIDASEDPPTPPPASMRDCPVFTMSSHVAEVTALHFQRDTLVSGSADKTLRQWDLTTGRCVQTLDVLWAAAQASTVSPPGSSSLGGQAPPWRQPGRQPDSNADFVGALQVFDAALACGTADGLIRLWDLRSGQVHRSLVGHTGAVTCLQFDDVHLVTGSADRSIRIWDLRTGTIHDAFAYDAPLTSMSFDRRSIVAAAGETVVKVYDKAEARQWDCGLGSAVQDDEFEQASTPPPPRAVVQSVRVKDGYMVEGRRDGMVGVWSV